MEANLACAILLGVERNKLIRAQFRKFVTQKDSNQWVLYFMNALNRGEKQICTLTLKRDDGSIFPARLESIQIIRSDGTPTVRVALSDIKDIQQVQEALKESEERYRSLYVDSRDAVMMISPEQGFLAANPATIRMFACRDEQDFNTHTPASLSPEYQPDGVLSADKSQEMMHLALETGSHFFEWTHRRVDGTVFPATVLLSRLESGGTHCLQATVRDITEQKTAEEALRRSEEKFRILIENSHDIIYTLTPDGIFTFVSPAWTALLGHPVSEVTGHSFQPFVHPDDLPGCMAWLQKAIETGQRQEGVEYRVRHIDGSWHWHTTSAVPLRDKAGTIIGFEGTARDITERKQAGEELKVHDEKIRLLLDSTAEAIYGLDMNGNCTFCNNSCLRLLGYKHPRELLGKNMHWQIHAKYPDGTHFPVEECRIFMAFNKGEGTHVDDEVLWRSDGTSFPAEYWSYPQRHNGVVVGAVVTFIDISDRKELEKEMLFHEQELMKFSSSLATANKKLSLLSSITRHDINNQLTVLMGYLAILQKKQPDTAHNEYFQKVSGAAQRIASMIQFTSEYEKIGVNAPTWQDCRSLIDTAAKEAPLGKIVIKNDLPPGQEVFADPLIRKVFYNLMDNAVRYGGKITTIRFSVEVHDGEHVVVCEDDGDGVVAEEKEKIFERGFGKNTGLGLALAREILDITGITITETGEPCTGARFEMVVPKGAWR